jgi:uncharacterized membrane protein
VRTLKRLLRYVMGIAFVAAGINRFLHTQLYPQFSATAFRLRLPLQAVLIAWAWWLTRAEHHA